MPEELLLRPFHFVGNLRQEGAAMPVFSDEESVTVELELVDAVNAPHGGEHGNLDGEAPQFIACEGVETPVFEGSGLSHLGNEAV